MDNLPDRKMPPLPPGASSWARLLRLRVMHMRWEDLAFLHWPVEAETLERRLPDGLRIDAFDNRAWLGVIPFRMTQVRPAWMPPMLGVSTFPELNVRTYVVADGIPGIWFFSLDAMQFLAVHAARTFLNLPYHYARASIESKDGGIHWRSERMGGDPISAARLTASYRPVGDVYRSRAGDLDHWLTERYCLYSVSHRGKLFRQAISHRPWSLQAAEAEVADNTMLAANDLPAVSGPPLIHFSRDLDVWACLPEPV